jgi:hypothetical protein
MLFEASIVEAMVIVGAVGAIAGLLGGLLAGADSLIGALLMGIIGGISLSAILRIANAPSIYAVGNDFSLVWAAVGGLLLGYVVGRSNV